ncbi:MAG TPA: ATP-binding protein [Acidimicrobiales bacterium]
MSGSGPAGMPRRIERLRDRLGAGYDEPAIQAVIAELLAMADQLEDEAARLDDAQAALRADREQFERAVGRSADLFRAVPAACLVTDAEGIVRQVNAAAEELLGAQKWIGKPLVLRVAQRDRSGVHARVTAAHRGAAPEPLVVTLACDQESRPSVELRCVPTEGGQLLWVLDDVTDREVAEDRLKKAIEHERATAAQLRDLNEVRDAFILAVSHDLQAPLAGIVGLAGLLDEQPRLAAADRRRMISQIRTAAERLLAELRALLDLERLRRGDIGLDQRRVDLADLVREVLGQIDVGGRRVTLDCAPLMAVVDPVIVGRILTNLLTNAARHTPPESQVWVRCSREPDGLLLVVEDDGPGVPDELQPRVFDLFRRGQRPGGVADGFGVGLALVRQFAELHGGLARVEDRRGGGASFQVLLAELPLSADAPVRR